MASKTVPIYFLIHEGRVGLPRQFSLMCSTDDSVNAVKERLVSLNVFDGSTTKCSLIYEGRLMAKDAMPIKVYGIENDGDRIRVILRSIRGVSSETLKLGRFNREILRAPNMDDYEGSVEIVSYGNLIMPSVLTELAEGSSKGLSCHKPVSTGGARKSGSYYMWDALSGGYKSVFKPADEEPNNVNDPDGIVHNHGRKRGVKPGEGFIREAAAYLLDYSPKTGDHGSESGFSGVPATCIVKVKQKGRDGIVTDQTGSLQRFMESKYDCGEIGTGVIKMFPNTEVHKIAVLDIRTVNVDRHPGNILVQEDEDDAGRRHYSLIPIDHGYCFPSCFDDVTLDWVGWAQSKEAFNQQTVEYVEELDALKDLALLKKHGWEMPTTNERVFMMGTTLLKKGVERGLSAYDIGSLMLRDMPPDKYKIAPIEHIFEAADAAVPEDMGRKAFLLELERSVGEFLDSRFATKGLVS